jgi:hypothetical protein
MRVTAEIISFSPVEKKHFYIMSGSDQTRFLLMSALWLPKRKAREFNRFLIPVQSKPKLDTNSLIVVSRAHFFVLSSSFFIYNIHLVAKCCLL